MIVQCRAQLGDFCLHGYPVETVYGREPISSDGTWDGRTVVCTPCYARLLPHTPSGQGLNKELSFAIRSYRAAHLPAEERARRFVEMNEDDGYVVTEEPFENGVKMTIWKDGNVEGGAVLLPGRPILWQ